MNTRMESGVKSKSIRIHTLRQTQARWEEATQAVMASSVATIEDVKAVFEDRNLAIPDEQAESILKRCAWRMTEAIQIAVDGILEEACVEEIDEMEFIRRRAKENDGGQAIKDNAKPKEKATVLRVLNRMEKE